MQLTLIHIYSFSLGPENSCEGLYWFMLNFLETTKDFEYPGLTAGHFLLRVRGIAKAS